MKWIFYRPSFTWRHQDLLHNGSKCFNLVKVQKQDAGKKRVWLPALGERVRQLGGELKVWSRGGKGTHLSFFLPVKKKFQVPGSKFQAFLGCALRTFPTADARQT